MLSHNLLLTGDDAYTISRSLRFRSSASAYLNRTFTTPTDTKKFTWSGWVKRGNIGGATNYIFSATPDSYTTFVNFGFVNGSAGSVDYLTFDQYSGGYQVRATTNAIYRDPSAWYHIVLVWDSANATSTDRTQIWVNGVRATVTYHFGPISQNASSILNANGSVNYISRLTSNYFDGYLAEVNFIDGQALTPSSFGETDAQTGVWKPKKYSGAYGTNGFYLNFSDNSNNTAATIGKDYSGNGNNWTPNNISVTSGSTYDSMTDVPTLTSESAANYAVVNPLKNGGLSITNANLRIAQASASWVNSRATVQPPIGGKYYVEFTSTQNWTSNNVSYLGLCTPSMSLTANIADIANIYTTTTSGEVLALTIDRVNNEVKTYRNNSLVATTSISATDNIDIAFASYQASGDVNFGQRPFAYTPPTGFKALNTFNLPTPTIGATASTTANKYFDILTWTGTSTSSGRTFTGLGFQPDFVWTKARNQAYSHQLYDANRGTGKRLQSNTTDAETTNPVSGYISAFNSDGFTTVAGTTDNSWFNELNTTHVAWNWRAGNSTSSNTSGSITSTVSANTSAGFSIATFSTPGGYSTGTVGHGLGVTPSMIIVKNRTAPSGAINWNTYHSSIGNTGALYLNSTSATVTSSAFWNNTSPTSTLFTVGTNLYASTNYVAYCFAEVAGYSRFGSYTGNGSTDGPFVFTGFRPRYLLIKRSDSTGSWNILDTVRDTYNLAIKGLYTDLSDAEDTSRLFDILSNGFKIRSSTVANLSSGTYIYAAFAESPFKYSLAR
jgi:hypothetical protein